jgi:hypothetical protein
MVNDMYQQQEDNIAIDEFVHTPTNPKHDVAQHQDVVHPSDEDEEFSDDEDAFIMLTLAVTLSQQVASQSTETQVPFTRSMLNMLGDRLHNVPKDCQSHSPFESKGCRPDIPRTKALALHRKIKKDSALHRYDHLSSTTFMVYSKMLCNIQMFVLQVSLTSTIMP